MRDLLPADSIVSRVSSHSHWRIHAASRRFMVLRRSQPPRCASICHGCHILPVVLSYAEMMTRGYLSCIWSLFFSRNTMISASEIGSRIYVRHRERSAFMTVKLGFSVVAPMRVMMPFSTHGRRTSCCDFDQRCISSRNSIVCRQSVKFFCALAMILMTSSFFLSLIHI